MIGALVITISDNESISSGCYPLWIISSILHGKTWTNENVTEISLKSVNSLFWAKVLDNN